MVCRTSFEFEPGLVVFVVDGALDVAAVMETIERFCRDPRHEPGMNRLWDMRDADLTPISADGIQGLVTFLASSPYTLHEGRRAAFVVSSDVNFGIARMFELYSDRIDPGERRVFRDMAAARTWVTAAPDP